MNKFNLRQKLLAMIIAGFAAVAPLSAQAIWNGTAASDWTGGGTEFNPYLITTAEQLAGIAAAVSEGNEFEGKYIKLANDLYLSDPAAEHDDKPQWTPIGNIEHTMIDRWDWEVDTVIFKGTFDGGGHTIHNVYYSVVPDFSDWHDDDPTVDPEIDFSGWNKGFFGYVEGATIKNLHLADAVMIGASTIGGLVAHNKGGTISNCSIMGEIGSSSDDVGGAAGGLVGINYENGVIENCRSEANVRAVRGSGGIVGINYGTIRESYATGKSRATQYQAGGFVGLNAGYIENCYAVGDVQKDWYAHDTDYSTGGFAGANGANATITNCYATGNITAARNGAGFVGSNAGTGVITNCYATGNVAAGYNAAVFVGTNGSMSEGYWDAGVPATMVNCFAIGSATSGSYESWAVGFAGVSHGDGPVINCYYNKETYADKLKSGGADMKTTAQMQTQAFVDTLNMMSAFFGLNTWEYHAGGYPTPTGPKTAKLTDYLEGGSGTESDPYRIKTKAQLENFATYVNKGCGFIDKHVKLEVDIALNAPQSEWGNSMPTQWTPIGGKVIYTISSTSSSTDFAFMGTFDGGGHEISNLYINNANDYQGLFGMLKGATVKNLGITNAWIKAKDNVGVLSGSSNRRADIITTIKQCYTSGLVEAGYTLGGFTGHTEFTSVVNSYSTAVVSSASYATAIGGDVTNCYFAGKVSGWDNTYIYHTLSEINNSFFDSETTGWKSSTKGTAKTTVQMQSKELVNQLNYWVTTANEQEVEPYLYWQHNADDYPTLTATVPPHTITYNSNGGTAIVAQQVLDASKTAPPLAPEKADYVFAGWYADEALTVYFDFDTEMITANITLYAKWVEPFTFDINWYNPFSNTYIISTKEQLAGFAALVNGTSGSYASPIDFYEKTIKLGNDILLNDTTDWKRWGEYASALQWTPIGTQYARFNGTFDGCGYKISGMYVCQSYSEVGLFGYTGADAMIKNLGVIASYSEGYNDVGALVGNNKGQVTECYVFANVAGHGSAAGGLIGGNGGNVSDCFAIGTVRGYEAVGGLVGNNGQATITNCYAATKVLGFEKYGGGLTGYGYSPNSYFDSNVAGVTVGGIGKTTVLMKQKGTFENWDFAETWGRNNAINSGYPYLRYMVDSFIEDDEDITATVTFVSNGGSEIAPQIVSLGTKASKPITPENENEYAIFNNWYADEDLTITFNFNNIITSDTTIYAKWTIPTWTLYFYSAGGITVPAQYINYGEHGVRPEDPARPHYVFEGWFNQSFTTEFDFDAPRTTDITVYAKWVIDTHTVTFVTNGGTDIAPVTIDCGTYLTEPATPTRAEHIFKGWYADEDLTIEFDFNNTIKQDTTIYLKWTVRPQMTLPYTNNFATAASVDDWIMSGVTWGSDNGGQLTFARNAYAELPILPAGVKGCKITINCSRASRLSLQTSSDGINYAEHDFDNDEAVDLPDGTRYVKLIASGTVTLASISITAQSGPVVVPVTDVTLNKNATSLTIGETEQLTATVLPTNATNKAVSWQSSNPSVADVVDGLITALSEGKTTITVTTADGNKTAQCVVTVTTSIVSVTDVTLNKNTVDLIVGETEQLTATVLPENADNKAVSWQSSNPSVAVVADGWVIAQSEGTTTITVTTSDGNKTEQCVVTVSNPTVAVTDVTLNKNAMSLIIGKSEQLIATVLPENAENKTVSWASSNPSVAVVADGWVIAQSEGIATITVTTADGNKTAQCVVTVTNPTVAVTGVTLDKLTLTLTVDDTEQLQVSVEPVNATNKNVSWESDNTAVATVGDNGLVTAIAAGTATIIVTSEDGGRTAQCVVTVNDKTGIATLASNSIRIYPNPVKETLIMDSGNLLISKLEIVDLSGHSVLILLAEDAWGGFDVSALSQGIYFVKIETDKGTAVKKIMKE